MGMPMRRVVRRIWQATQSALQARGVYVTLSRISNRNRPQLLNRAIWRPFVAPDRWRELYERAQQVTRGESTDNVFRQCRFYSTFQLAHYAAGLSQGDVVECGCWHGHSTVAIATILAAAGFAGRFHVFDSFEGGLSDFGPKDESPFALSAAEKAEQINQFRSDLGFVRSVTESFGFVELHPGWIPQSFAGVEPRSIRFLHVDVDMYEPTKASLEFFWDKIVKGGCIVVDDYNHAVFEGATRAVDEFLKDKSPQLFYSVPLGSACIIK
jgi:O-methyltransferase